MNHWLNKNWHYANAASHDSTTAFRRRMHERQRAADAEAAEAAKKVQPFAKRKTG